MDAQEEFKFVKPGQVRTRFAPAPTGMLHIGSARTCLFNYLFTKRHQGRLVLRIEDTDPERSRIEYEEDIIKHLGWLGIEWEEGPYVGGNHGPYKQSQRGEIYAKYIKKLLDEGKAYHCFCSPEELEARRQYLISIGHTPVYKGECLQLSKEEVEKKLNEGKPSVIRFKTPSKKVIFEDMIRNKVEFDTSLIGDLVIAKDFTTPLYNLACAIDDFEMKISHVIRGEDHISNTPKQILIQEALDFPHPAYGHLPLILGRDRSKLSKRHGAVSVAEYKEKGYLPETLVNFIAFLGWNPGTEREIYSISSLVKNFSVDRIQKGGAVFNPKRLDWLNGFYIRQKSLEKLTELCLSYLIGEGLIEPIFKSKQYPPAYGGQEIIQTYKISETGKELSFNDLKKIVAIYQERLKKLSEISDLIDFFFKKTLRYEKSLLRWKKMNDKEIRSSLDKLEKVLSKTKKGEWTKENLYKLLTPVAETFEDRGYLLWPFRVALTGKKYSADPFEIAEIFGRQMTLQRIKDSKKILKSQ